MDLNVLFWLVVAGIVGVWLLHRVPEPAEALGGIFGFREALWPTGVQEDDDAHWSWASVKRDRPEPLEVIDTAAVDLDRPRPSSDSTGGGK